EIRHHAMFRGRNAQVYAHVKIGQRHAVDVVGIDEGIPAADARKIAEFGIGHDFARHGVGHVSAAHGAEIVNAVRGAHETGDFRCAFLNGGNVLSENGSGKYQREPAESSKRTLHSVVHLHG